MQLTLGIDTGGTYTDGVLFDPSSRKVVRAAKVLTTHTDLTICIFEIIGLLMDAFEEMEDSRIGLVSLSTTLATNAIAEGKRKPVALLLLGYDPVLVARFRFEEAFGTPYYFFIDGKHDLNGRELLPLDEEALTQAVCDVDEKVEAYAVVSYAGARNTAHEERAAAVIAAMNHKPVVLGHHLSQELDSIRRATTASLNASLLSNTQAFVQAVEGMLHKHGVNCPVMIVRGDGSVAGADYIRKRPVEIIHSGPATSAIGGQFLAGVQNGLVIDVGGTTTDIALVENGIVLNGASLATVGPYHTSVRTIKARSFGLGGDSFIRFDRHQRISIGPERVLPLAHLCTEFPAMAERLAQWITEKSQVYHFGKLECWILRKPDVGTISNPRTAKVVEILRSGPCLLPELLKKTGAVSPMQLRVDDLINREIIERAGFTPTDLLHITGDYAPWQADIARMFLGKAASLLELAPEQFSERLWAVISDKMAEEILEFISGKTLSEPGYVNRRTDLDRWLFEESLRPLNPHVESAIRLRDPIIGIGAPAKAFLTDAARLLGTTAVFPDHYEVANAVGTVVGNVIIRMEGEVVPDLIGADVDGYTARIGGLQASFSELHAAKSYIRKQLADIVYTEAVAAGAADPLVDCEEKEILDGLIVQFSAWAVGKAQ